MYLVLEKESGNDSGEVTPVPMPNTVVKLSSAYGSWGLAPARVGRCQAIYIGGLAQLGEHLPYKQGVAGSSPASSTICRSSSIGRATDL
jgi:hypothetical protein